MKELLEIIEESISIIKKFPEDREVVREQSLIIRRRAKELQQKFGWKENSADQRK